MKPYTNLLKKILAEGETRGDRTGTGTLSIFGGQIEFDLRESFPLVTIKKTLWKSAFIEMLWFLRGEPNTSYLKQHGVPIWDDWADKDGNLGPIYGVQWRKWPGKVTEYITQDVAELLNFQDGMDLPSLSVVPGTEKTIINRSPDIDQIKELIAGIKKNPEGRRHIVTAWNPTYLKEMGLPPCHRDFQCYVSNDGYLDLMMAIRSWDTCLGGPFNIAQYAMLTHLIARATGLKPMMLKINYGDAHIYSNHVDKIREVLETREPIDCKTELVFNTDNTDIDGYKIEDFDVTGYESHPFVKLPIAV
jgi:thymidylate synthase